jgi:hypothetical protein
MFTDPIVEEVRRARQEYVRQFNYDLHAIADDLRKQEQQHAERLVSFPARHLHKTRTT